VNYIGGLDEDDAAQVGLSMGENVILSRIIAAVYNVPGVDDVQVQLSKDGETYEAANIIMQRPQIAQISANAIEVI